jgi:5-methyltetrahydrofolate--homocysteine methyltransferase
MAAFFGSRAEFRPETVWYHPIIEDWDTAHLRFDRAADPLYRATIDATRYYVQENRDRYLVSLPELGSASDDLSLLRGMQPLVLDMMQQPSPVKTALRLLADTWIELNEELYAIAAGANDGGCPIGWMQTWAPGPHFQMSCDLSAVLSPALFDEFIVPELQTYLQVNEYAVYHWDGPDAIKFLDSLLAIEGIDAIQWTQGAGSPPVSDPRWIPLYRKIQAAGKRLILPFVEIDEVEALLAQISSRGLLIGTTAQTEQEARDLLRRVAGWTRD